MFLESLTIASACNKVLRLKILKPNTIGLFPTDPSVVFYSAETNTFYDLFGWHGCACQPCRDLITTNGDTLAAEFEERMVRLDHITRAEYQVKVKLRCEFDDAAI